MNRKTEILLGRWVHSDEEDTKDAFVYRRRGYTLPASRGRQQMAFTPDNQVKVAGIGANDLNELADGIWSPNTGPGADFEIILEYEDDARQVELTDDGAPKLMLKKRAEE